MTEQYQADYDVVVVGFGGAGATAARFAADNGAKVLIVETAPYGNEGGNTRYSAQLIGTGEDFDEAKTYYLNLTKPLSLPEDMVDTFVHGMVNMRKYVKDYLDVEPFSMEHDDNPFNLQTAIHEFPEYEGNETYDFTTVHKGLFDAALWKILRQKVLDRKDNIDVWLSSRARHLIQNPETKKIEGVVVERDGKEVKVLARKGVVLALGGFENNPELQQNYLGAPKLSPLGTIYNRGDGIKMAAEVGAKLWHMYNYESLGMMHGLSFDTDNERSVLYLGSEKINHGSVFVVTDDGKRYFNETEPNRHGHIFDHGAWRVPRTHEHTYLVFDQKQYDEMKERGLGTEKLEDFDKLLVKADSLRELAEKIGVNADNFEHTVKQFGEFAENGEDVLYGRDPESMRAFGEGPYYGVKLIYNVLNTQGGPERNTHAEILDNNNEPIPHLYGAGELGGICANEYQGGGNLAECLIFGKIAGENVAKVEDEVNGTSTGELNGINDLADGENQKITLKDHQYLGSSNRGLGGKVTVRVTYDSGKIENVEVVEEHESEDVAKHALKEMPEKIVAANSVEVDAVSGASSTSNAIREAVSDALSKAR